MVYGSGFHGCEKKSHIVTFFLRKKKKSQNSDFERNYVKTI